MSLRLGEPREGVPAGALWGHPAGSPLYSAFQLCQLMWRHRWPSSHPGLSGEPPATPPQLGGRGAPGKPADPPGNSSPWGLRTYLGYGRGFWFSVSHRLSNRGPVSQRTAHCPILLSSFNSGETVLFGLHIKRSLNEMKSSSFNKQHKYLILF